MQWIVDRLKWGWQKFGQFWTGTELVGAMLPRDLLQAASTPNQPTPEDIQVAEDAYIAAYRTSTGRQNQPNQPNQPNSQPYFGLALSGGGIRSASIALGAMQALAAKRKLPRFDYLSTVSGGGYSGSALTWFTCRENVAAGFGTGDGNPPSRIFPYGVNPPTVPARAPLNPAQQLLRFLRQHANYLSPGKGITLVSAIALVLRGIMVNLFIWIPPISAILFGLIMWDQLPTEASRIPAAFKVSFIAGVALVAALGAFGVIYSLMSGGVHLGSGGLITWVVGLFSRRAGKRVGAVFKLSYGFRRLFDRWSGWILFPAAGLLILASVAFVDRLLAHGIVATPAAGILSVGGGALSGIWTFLQSRHSNGKKMPSIVPAAGALLLLYGVLILSYHIAFQVALDPAMPDKVLRDMQQHLPSFLQSAASWIQTTLSAMIDRAGKLVAPLLPAWLSAWRVPTGAGGLIGLAAVSVIAGLAANLNFTSLHRYYRDRLMEAFLPDIGAARENQTAPARRANKALLSEMCDARDAHGPYHLVNTNLMLNDSRVPAWRLRGGDSFILSPRYCGSSATGWIKTEDWMDDDMNLATAMAISGAAANPGAGSGGIGPTRDRAVSTLMALLNLRLGYWVPNPSRGRTGVGAPNHFRPALLELLGVTRGENAHILQLSDGGHFDNLGLYEMIRRRLPLVLVCDGTADPDFAFPDLLTLLPRIREDFGARINFNRTDPAVLATPIDALIPIEVPGGGARFPSGAKLAGTGFMIATIEYANNTRGVLIYLKAAALADMDLELLGYKGQVSDFPNESTLDQFYSDAKFEAHRGIGYALVEQMLTAAVAYTGRSPALDALLAP
jgi:hypothetical protein